MLKTLKREIAVLKQMLASRGEYPVYVDVAEASVLLAHGFLRHVKGRNYVITRAGMKLIDDADKERNGS